MNTDFSGDEQESCNDGDNEEVNLIFQRKQVYLVEHLATFTVNKDSNIICPFDGMQRLLQLEKSTGIWSQKMQLYLKRDWVLIIDYETGSTIEKFPVSSIREPTAFASKNPMDLYNNILVFIVSGCNCARSEMHIFQSQSVSAKKLALHLKSLQRGRAVTEQLPNEFEDKSSRGILQSRTTASNNNINNDPYSSNILLYISKTKQTRQSVVEADTIIGSDEYNVDTSVPISEANIDARICVDTTKKSINDESSSISSENYERDVNLLNRCFDDIEKFIARLQHAAAASRELERRRRSRKNKKRDPGDGLLSLRTKLPLEKEFVDIFAKFKLSFNLLARLKTHIHDPNAPELVHFLFTPLALIVEAASDTYSASRIPSHVITPLLTRQAINLLINCVTSKETELWRSLGNAWIVPREQWKENVNFYHPIFMDGWSPDYLIADTLYSFTPSPVINHSKKLPERERKITPSTEQVLNSSHNNGCDHNEKLQIFKHYQNFPISINNADLKNSDFKEYNSVQNNVTPRVETATSYAQSVYLHKKSNSLTNPLNEQISEVYDCKIEKWLAKLQMNGATIVTVTYPRKANNEKELSVSRGEYLEILDDSRKWWKARNIYGHVAHVPHTILTPFYCMDSNIENQTICGVHQSCLRDLS